MTSWDTAYFLGVLWKLALFLGVPLVVLCWADEKHKGLFFRLYLRWRARQESGERSSWAERFDNFRNRKIGTDWAGEDDDGDEYEVFAAPARRVAHARRGEPRPQAE